MNREDIIRMARESGMELYGLGKDRERFIYHLERFAALVAAAERQACAKVVEAYTGAWDDQGYALAAKYERDTGKKLTRIVPMAEQPAHQEPVAWISESENLLSWDKFYDHMTPLYTSPPASKPWVGLTDEEIQKIWRNSEHMTVNQVCRAIEAKLREKNA